MSWVRIEVPRVEGLPPDRLDPEELQALRRLLEERDSVVSQAQALEQQVQLLLMVARDRRGLVGPVRVDPQSGCLEVENG